MSILNAGKCKNSYITSILENLNDKSVDNPNDIANIFPQGNHTSHSTLRVTTQDESFYPVTSHEIWTFIVSTNASKSFGPYRVAVTILKSIRDYISGLLTFLVNDSFASGNFPEKLKLARITPIFKRGSTFDKDSFRPISVLSTFSKTI